MADPLQRSQQQQTDQDLWKFSAVSAVAATADLVAKSGSESTVGRLQLDTA